MSVITISRKLGSMGTYIGKKLAEDLGYSYLDKHHLSKIMRDYGFSKFDNIYDTMPSYWERYDVYRESTINFLAEVIMAVAHHGNVVIAGRGGFGLLNSYTDVINIRIKATESCRVRRLMDDRSITEPEALKVIRDNDRIRRAFVESDFRFSYTDSREFDFIFDTSIAKPDTCLSFLSTALKEWKPDQADQPQCRDIKVEPVLVEHVQSMLSFFNKNKEEILKRTEE